MQKRVVGTFAKMLHAIPVVRPQDIVKQGTGLITYDSNSGKITGSGTMFSSEVKAGDVLNPEGFNVVVKSVESDKVIVPAKPCEGLKDMQFKIQPKIDQSEIYESVQRELRTGRCVGIFPEGGSHDRTTLLPLKAGVCLMALGTMARYNVPVTIQCVGLNYFRGHKFRSKAVVNFGVPYKVPKELAKTFLQDRTKAVGALLKQIEKRLQEVWVTAPSYEELSYVFMARRVYKPNELRNDPVLDMDMNIKFAKGYRVLKENYPDSEELKETVDAVVKYSKDLKRLGLHDYQLRLKNISKKKMLAYSLVTLVRIITALLVALPGTVFAGILGLLVNWIAEKERQKALAKSSVKIHGYDVLASFKVVYGFVLIIVISVSLGVGYFFYSYCKFHLDTLDSLQAALFRFLLFMAVWPIYFYISIVLSDRAFELLGRLHARILSILSPNKLEKLQLEREQVKEKVTKLVNKYGPQIFPGLKPGSAFKQLQHSQLEQMINEAFGSLSEIGL